MRTGIAYTFQLELKIENSNGLKRQMMALRFYRIT